MKNIDKVCEQAVAWIKQNVESAGAKGVVLGLSGGIDSAVVAALCKKAFPENTLTVMMPCYSNPVDEEHALLVADALKLNVKKVLLNDAFDTMKKLVGASESDSKLVLANIKSRLRMVTLYYYAGINNYLVVGTGNKSELTIGYFTKYGDGGVDMLPIASFVKKEVWELARYLGIPDVVIDKAPTAGLWEDQTDETEMGMSYEALDNYILTGAGSAQVKERVDSMFARSEHKRKMPPAFFPDVD